jgi:excisionase family DNA binding protein
MGRNETTPILVPIDPEMFWEQMRLIIREEINNHQRKVPVHEEQLFQTAGLTYKPLYKMTEVCKFFQISRPTVYDWIKQGKLKPYKIQSRVYFLYEDIRVLLKVEGSD